MNDPHLVHLVMRCFFCNLMNLQPFFFKKGKKNNMRTMGFPPTGSDEEKVKLKLFQGLEGHFPDLLKKQ